MRVSCLFVSALVAFSALTTIAPVSGVTSPAQTKIEALKSLIESSHGVSVTPAAVCAPIAAAAAGAVAPPRSGFPTPAEICSACKAVLEFPASARSQIAICDSISDARVKSVCQSQVQPYFLECGNKAKVDLYDGANAAKAGSISSQTTCNSMQNGAPGKNGQPFCQTPSLMEVATEVTTPPCDMCRAYVKASRASRLTDCKKKNSETECTTMENAFKSVNLYDDGTNSCEDASGKAYTPCKASILCGFVPFSSPAHPKDKNYCTAIPGYKKHQAAAAAAAAPASAVPAAAAPTAASPKKLFLEAAADAQLEASLTPAETCTFCQAFLKPAKEYRAAECQKAAGTDAAKKALCATFESAQAKHGFHKYEKDGCFLAKDSSFVKACPAEAICTFVTAGQCHNTAYIATSPASAAPPSAAPGAAAPMALFLEGHADSATMTRAEAECSMCQLITTVAANRRTDLCSSQLIAEPQKELCRSVYQGVYLKHEAAFKEIDNHGCFQNGKKLDVCPSAAVCAMIGHQCPNSDANGFSLKNHQHNSQNKNQQDNKSGQNTQNGQNNNQAQNNNNSNKNTNQNNNQGNNQQSNNNNNNRK